MLDSMACVDACASQDHAGKSEKGSHAGQTILIITDGHVFQHRARFVRTWTFGQATLAEYGVDKGGIANG
jgi:hypothetical protein